MRFDMNKYEKYLKKGSDDQEPCRMRTIVNYISTINNNGFLVPQNHSNKEIKRINKLLKNETRQVGVVIRSVTKFLYGLDVAKLIKISKKKRRRIEKSKSAEQTIKEKSLTDKEINLLIRGVTVRLGLFVSLSFDAGGRGTETLTRKYKDFDYDFDKEIGGYPLKLKESNQHDIIKRGKPRDVCISKRTMDLLKQHMRENNVSKESNKLVFEDYYTRNIDKLSDRQRAIERSNVIKRLNKELGKASQELLGKRITSHWLRHSTLTSMALKSVDLLSIKEYAGHTDPKTTLLYIKASGALSRKAFKDWTKKGENNE